MSDNDIEVPSNDELLKLADDIASSYVKNGMKIYASLDPDSRPYPTDYRDGLEADVDWLKPKFEEFLTPVPGDFTAKLDAMDSIAKKLGTGNEDTDFVDGEVNSVLHSARGYMEEWEGTLATSFRDNYLDHMADSVVYNQGAVTLILRENFDAMRNIYVEARKSLKDTGTKGVAAMDQADGIGSAGLTTLLTVLGGAFGIGAATLSAAAPVVGPAVGITTAVVSAGIAVANDQKPKDKEIPLAADYPDEVLDNIKGALDELRKDVDEKELELKKTMLKTCEEVLKEVGNTTEATNLVPLMPDLVHTALEDSHGFREGLVQIE